MHTPRRPPGPEAKGLGPPQVEEGMTAHTYPGHLQVKCALSLNGLNQSTDPRKTSKGTLPHFFCETWLLYITDAAVYLPGYQDLNQREQVCVFTSITTGAWLQ